MTCLLYTSVSDIRGSNECLYVFYSKENTFSVQDSVMGLVMPHIDSVLRKIQHLEPVEVQVELFDELDPTPNAVALSEREPVSYTHLDVYKRQVISPF